MTDSKGLRPGLCTIDQYLSLPRDKATWILRPLLPIGGSMLLYGAEKTGKSYLAIQLALAISNKDEGEWLGFPIVRHGRVVYLQLDTPRSLWAWRFEDMIKQGGLKYNGNLLLADRECIEPSPLDVLQPQHCAYLHALFHQSDPLVVIVDTLRMAHSGDEDSSTTMRNVLANLVALSEPAALILISHSRKPHPDSDKDLMADHRGSSFITGGVDAIMRLTKSRLYFTGRSIEEGNVKIERMENGLWQCRMDMAEDAALQKVLTDSSLSTLRAKARVLASLTASNEETCLSRIRRAYETLRKQGSESPQVLSNQQLTAENESESAK